MDSELSNDNDELALINIENCTELDMTNDGNNAVSINSSINLTDKVKNIIDNLVIESFRHKEYQRNCFEELIKIWLGENFLAISSTLDIKKETDRFDDCKAYIFKTIAKYLPDGENEIYSSYYDLKKIDNITVDTDGKCTIYNKDQFDVNQLFEYIRILNKKINRQYLNLKYNFQVYLTEKLEDAEFYKLNNDPVLEILRRSQRNTTKVTDYKPFLQFNKTKIKRTITYFLKTNTTSNTASKKRKVKPFNDLYLQYIFDCILYIT
jgi:hypothetical protein